MGNAEVGPGNAGAGGSGGEHDRHSPASSSATTARERGAGAVAGYDPMEVGGDDGDAASVPPPGDQASDAEPAGDGDEKDAADDGRGGKDNGPQDSYAEVGEDEAHDDDDEPAVPGDHHPPSSGGTQPPEDQSGEEQSHEDHEDAGDDSNENVNEGAEGDDCSVSDAASDSEKQDDKSADVAKKSEADDGAADSEGDEMMDAGDGQDRKDNEKPQATDRDETEQNGTSINNEDAQDEGALEDDQGDQPTEQPPTPPHGSSPPPKKQAPLHDATLKAMADHLKSYAPLDTLDDDEVIDVSKKAYDAAQRRRQRKREMLIFGAESSSNDEDSEDSSKASDVDGDKDEDDPEKAMWNCKDIDKNFFESIVAAAAEQSSASLLAGRAVDDKSAESSSEDDADNDDTDNDDRSRASSTRSNGARISHKQKVRRLQGKSADFAPRAAMDERTLDVVRRSLGLRVTEYEYTSSGRRRKKHHYHHHHHHHHHHHQPSHHYRPGTSDESDGGRSSDREGSTAVAAKPTRVTRRVTKQHRQKRREERALRENRGVEALFSAAMGIELEVDGEVFTAETLLKARDQLKRKGEVESDSDDTDEGSARGGRRRKRPAPTGRRDEESSGDESTESRAPKMARSEGEVPLPARVPMSAEELERRRSPSRLMSDEMGEEEVDEESGVVYRPVTVTRLVVGGKPVILAKLGKQILDAAKARKKREKDAHLAAMRRKRAAHAEERKREKRRRKGEKSWRRAKEDFFDYSGEAKVFDEEGPIFGEIIKDYDLYERTGKNFNQPVSLSLLDWRRRQQWVPKGKKGKGKGHDIEEDNDFDFDVAPSIKGKKSQAAAALASSKLDSSQQIWETINLNLDMPKQPSTLEQPRRRHSDLTYATWCTQLIHCLSGSGRSMARHEFFYSDIDRAWFNSNPFQADVAKLGIPPNAKLTRSEWSLVRRRIPNRPRRFSKRFVTSQMLELERYRDFVRYIQRYPDSDTSDFFGYEVPAPIRIGATVTAVNKKARILHRGIVLDRDEYKKGYLVQFERKELGYEFCPDIEVASHGVPEIMIPAAELSLDGSCLGSFAGPNSELGSLAYGTTYGPLVEFHRRENRFSISQMRKLPASTVVTPYVLQVVEKSEGDNWKSRAAEEDTHEKMVEKVAERETLVKLMSLMHIMVERKAVLLKSIEAFHKRWQTFVKEGGETSGDASSGTIFSFKEHYAWLQANLALNNQSMEAALGHLQVMYGKAYAGQPSTLAVEDEKQRVNHMEHFIQEATHTPQCNSGLWNKWTAALVEKGDAIGHDLVSLTRFELKPPGEEIGDKDGDIRRPRSNFLESRMSSAAVLLQTTQLCGDSNGNKFQEVRPSIDPGVVGKVLEDTLHNLRPNSIRALPPDIVADVESMRESSFRDLTEAVAMFHAELAEFSAESSLIG